MPRFDRAIPPGGEGKITLQVKTAGYQGKISRGAKVYSNDPRNIGNLRHGKIDSIVTSPPYEGSETETGSDKGKRGGDSKLRAKKDYKEVSEDNIGSMKGET